MIYQTDGRQKREYSGTNFLFGSLDGKTVNLVQERLLLTDLDQLIQFIAVTRKSLDDVDSIPT